MSDDQRDSHGRFIRGHPAVPPRGKRGRFTKKTAVDFSVSTVAGGTASSITSGEARNPAPCLPLPPSDTTGDKDKVIKRVYRRLDTSWRY